MTSARQIIILAMSEHHSGNNEEAQLIADAVMRDLKAHGLLGEPGALVAGARLESAVADFLDAETAWHNDECEDATYNDALGEMKREMYALRECWK